ADAIGGVARDARRRQPREVAADVAAHARHHAVDAGQVAADGVVIEARGRPGLLGVTVTAARTEAVVVHVVVAVAGDAQRPGPFQQLAERVALVAGDAI